MIRFLYTIILLLLLCHFSLGADIQLSLNNESEFKVLPGNNISLSVKVVNSNEQEIEFIPDIELENEWKSVIPDSPFILLPNEESYRFMIIRVPKQTIAGKYLLKYVLKDSAGNKLEEINIDIEVLPRIELAIELINSPNFVIAGDEYELEYLVFNKGNQGAVVDYKIRSGENLPYTIKNTRNRSPLFLAAGETRPFTLTVSTPQNLSKLMNHRLEFRILIPEKFREKKSSDSIVEVSYVEIIPRISAKGETFFLIPSTLNNTVTMQFFNQDKYKLNTDYEVKGYLDEKNLNRIEFYLEKALDTSMDNPEQMLIHPKDTYRFQYWNPNFHFLVGDLGYSLSPLLEEYRFGRGVQLDSTLGPFHFGAYYHQNFWSSAVPHYGAGFFQWMLPNETLKEGLAYRVKMSAHTKNAGNLLAGLFQEWNPVDQINIQSDAALCLNQINIFPAFLVKTSGNHELFTYRLNFHYADPGFSGFYHDQYHFLSNASLNLFNGALRVFGAYQMDEKNLLQNPLNGNSLHENTINGAINYIYKPWNNNINFHYKNKNRKDLYASPEYNDWENVFSLGYRQLIKDLRFNCSGELSHSINTIDKAQLWKHNYLAGVGYKLNSNFDSSFSVHYSNKIPSHQSVNHILGWILNTRYEHPDLNLNGDVKNHFKIRDDQFVGVSFSVGIGFEYQFKNNQILKLTTHYTFSNNRDNWTNSLGIMGHYGLPISLPLGRKINIGSLKGELHDDETGAPVPGVIIRLGGQAVITDNEGLFYFSALMPGEYYLNIDRNHLGYKRIPKIKTPIQVKIEKGQNVNLSIPISQASSIYGRVVLYEFEDKFGNFVASGENSKIEENYKESRGLYHIVLEIDNGEEKKRSVSDSQGRYRFDELYSDTWKLSILTGNVPEYHYYEKARREFFLNRGESKEIILKVLPRKRQLEILNDLPLETLEIEETTEVESAP